MKKPSVRRVLKTINNYVVFFLVVAFAVTCCMMLFVQTLADTMGLVFTEQNIAAAAKITFVNVVLITLLFGTLDYVRRKRMVDRPVKIITEAAEKLMQGDFSVRVPPMHGNGMEGFGQIGIAINRMAEELAGTETLRTDFIANVSHELKTPLAVMGNYATMLQRSGITEEEKNEYAKAISEASRRLAQLITNILKLNKLENQQIFPQPQKFNLGEQLCECLLRFENVWEQKDIEIETDIAEDVSVEADAELLSLVWNNLFSNALKFTEAGGTVSVRLSASAHHAVVTVKDTGCGMSAEVGAHIFEKFYQGDTSHSVQGNGLGLALVKRVIDIMQGEIGVESAVCVGTTFTVKIRRAWYGLEEGR